MSWIKSGITMNRFKSVLCVVMGVVRVLVMGIKFS